MKILYVEDEIAHVVLTRRTLEENTDRGFMLVHAETIKDALEILDREPDTDLILSDLRLPDGTGLELLNKVRERKAPPPVVLVTGQGDQEAAVAALKAGAADYLVKQSDYLHRLPVVISNAIAQNRLLREQAALREAEVKYQSLIEHVSAVVFLDSIDEAETTLYMSPRIEELTGYTPDEWRANPGVWISSIHPDDRERIIEKDKETHDNRSHFLEEYRLIRRDGRVVWVKEDTNLIYDDAGNPLYWQGILLDITKEKETEAALQRQVMELAILQAATIAGTEGYSEDEIIEKVTDTIGMIFSEVCGILLLNEEGDTLTPHRSYRGADTSNWRSGFPITEGITGRAVSQGKIMRVGDITKEPEFIEVSSNIKSELCVPIQVNNRTIGVINVESRKPDAFDDNDEGLLITIASSLGTALERLRLFQEEQRRAKELNTLYQTARSLTESLMPEVIAQNLLNAMETMLGYQYGAVMMIEEATQLLLPLAISRKEYPEITYLEELGRLHDLKIRTDQGIVGWVIQNRRPIRVGDVSRDSRYIAVRQNVLSELCVPLIARNKVIGAIIVESPDPQAYTERDESLLAALANSAAIAIDNARLYQGALESADRRAVLHRISQDIVRFSQDFEQIYTAIHEAAGKLMPCDVFVIMLRDTAKGENIAVYTVEAGKRLTPGSVKAGQGLSASVINEGKSIILRNEAEINKREVIHFGSPRHVQSAVAVPMRIGDRVIGMISAQCYEPYAYDAEEQALLEMLATHAATAVENGRLFESEQKRRQEAETLRQAAAAISSTLDLNHVMEDILKALKQVIHYNSASVFLHEGDWLRLAICQGFANPESLINLKFPADDELFQQIRETRWPLIIEDVQKDARFKNWGATLQVRGWMATPLMTRGEVIGYITLDSLEVGAYNDSISETAMALANQAAAAIENARLFQEQSRRSKIIEALADIANEIATTREVIPALDQIAQRALDLLNANHVAIYLLQEDNITLKTVTAHGIYRKELFSHTRKAGEGITGNVFLKGKPEIINDTKEDPRRVVVPGTPEKEEKLATLMSAPLILRGKSIGVINAWRPRENGLFNESELNFLVSIAHQASICIESGRLFQETNRQAQEAAAIAEVGRDISATLQLDIVLERIASYAMVLLHAETSAVYLADPTTSTLHAIAVLGADVEEIKNDPLHVGTGILGNIALQNVGEIVNDSANDPRGIVVKDTEKNPLEHIMGVPILLKEQHTGLIAIWRSGSGTEFARRELDFLTSLARQAAVAIENARLYDETQRRLKELEIINRVSTSLRMTQSIDEMLPILLTESLELANTPHGSIWLYDHTSAQLVQRVASGAESKLKYTALNPLNGIVGHTFTTGIRYTSPELKNDPLLFEPNRESMAPGLAGVYIPIQSTAGPVGVLMISIETGREITEEINLLTILAEITGNSIHRAQLYDQSQRQVRRLTSLRDIDSAIASSFDLRLTLNILMDQTLNHLNLDAVDIGIYHPDLQSLTYLAGMGFNTPSPTRPQMRIGEGLAGQVILKQHTQHVIDLQNAPETRNEPFIKREGFVTYIGIPLIVKGQIKGVYEIFHRSPLSPTPDWMEFLHTLAGQAAIAIDSSQLFENLQRSNQELVQAYDTTLEGWARALELRDRETEGHTRRVTELTLRLARYMKIPDNEMVNIHRGVLLHDIGKMGVPDHILKKSGRLSNEEWNEMRMHPVYAYNLLSPISFLRGVLDIPYCHHEHWDGSGYPRGLRGEQIPLAARIFSVVDIWDALLSNRPYRKAWPRHKVLEYIKASAGHILDPKIVGIFLKMIENQEENPG